MTSQRIITGILGRPYLTKEIMNSWNTVDTHTNIQYVCIKYVASNDALSARFSEMFCYDRTLYFLDKTFQGIAKHWLDVCVDFEYNCVFNSNGVLYGIFVDESIILEPQHVIEHCTLIVQNLLETIV